MRCFGLSLLLALCGPAATRLLGPASEEVPALAARRKRGKDPTWNGRSIQETEKYDSDYPKDDNNVDYKQRQEEERRRLAEEQAREDEKKRLAAEKARLDAEKARMEAETKRLNAERKAL